MINWKSGLKMYKLIIFTALMIALTGCSSLNPLKSLSPTVGVEANIGKNNSSKKAVVGQVGSKQEITVESFSGGVTTINKEEIPLKYMLLMLLGWMLPSPSEMFKWTMGVISTIYLEFKNVIKAIFGLVRGESNG